MVQLRRVPVFRVKKGDFVEVMTGKHRGQRGKILRVLPKVAKVLVEGVNIVRASRPKREGDNDSRARHVPLPIGNVMVVCPVTDRPTRVRYVIAEDGTKYRVSARSGERI